MALAAGESEVLTGLVANSRPLETDGQRLLGLFLNTLPLRLEAASRAKAGGGSCGGSSPPSRTRCPIAATRRDACSAASARASRSSRRPSTTTTSTSTRAWPAATGIEVSQPRMFEYTNFTLMANFDLAPGGEGLVLRLNYDSAEIEAGQAESLAGYYLKALEALAAAPEAEALEADLLGAERATVLEAFNATQVAWRGEREQGARETLSSAFGRQARETPEAAAVIVDGGETLSYRELDERSNQVGRWLRAAGRGSGRRGGRAGGAFGGDDGGDLRGAEGGRGLPAPGGRVAGGAGRGRCWPTAAPRCCSWSPAWRTAWATGRAGGWPSTAEWPERGRRGRCRRWPGRGTWPT